MSGMFDYEEPSINHPSALERSDEGDSQAPSLLNDSSAGGRSPMILAVEASAASPAASSVVSNLSLDEDSHVYSELQNELLDTSFPGSPTRDEEEGDAPDPLFMDYPSSTRERLDQSLTDEFMPSAWRDAWAAHLDQRYQEMQDVLDDRLAIIEQKIDQTQLDVQHSRRVHEEDVDNERHEAQGRQHDQLLAKLDAILWQSQGKSFRHVCTRHRHMLSKLSGQDQQVASTLARWIASQPPNATPTDSATTAVTASTVTMP
ncbi:hypothetical protein BC940DRAFT_291259 [Gongronella butleri]|nr:hypothetical protein BC940DRAFT_291259 [Gongronella butleri]